MSVTPPDDSYESAFLTLPVRHSPHTHALYLQPTPSSSPLIDRPWPCLPCLPALPELYRILTSHTLYVIASVSVSQDPVYRQVKSDLNQLKINL